MLRQRFQPRAYTTLILTVSPADRLISPVVLLTRFAESMLPPSLSPSALCVTSLEEYKLPTKVGSLLRLFFSLGKGSGDGEIGNPNGNRRNYLAMGV